MASLVAGTRRKPCLGIRDKHFCSYTYEVEPACATLNIAVDEQALKTPPSRFLNIMRPEAAADIRLARAWSLSASDGIRSGLYDFVLSRFLHANRCPLRSKSLEPFP
ncbi:hypothetical protein [Nitrobacter sp. TKz-YC01]|uniref:hypothetical protein n=1 Tax=Nitrobacter sp. TKz-YC01 TaxID=3398703 RepID=UPI003A0FCACF